MKYTLFDGKHVFLHEYSDLEQETWLEQANVLLINACFKEIRPFFFMSNVFLRNVLFCLKQTKILII